jgi:hypothetical protein
MRKAWIGINVCVTTKPDSDLATVDMFQWFRSLSMGISLLLVWSYILLTWLQMLSMQHLLLFLHNLPAIGFVAIDQV